MDRERATCSSFKPEVGLTPRVWRTSSIGFAKALSMFGKRDCPGLWRGCVTEETADQKVGYVTKTGCPAFKMNKIEKIFSAPVPALPDPANSSKEVRL